MPVDPKYSNSSIVVPNPLANQQPRNNQVIQDQTRYAKPWGIRVYQGTHGIALSNFAASQIGFDTLSYNTYQGLGVPKFAFSAGNGIASATIGGNVFPYSTFTLPVSGIYDIKYQYILPNSTAGAQIVLMAWIVVNGSNSTQTLSSANTGGNGFNSSIPIVEEMFYEAGTSISFVAEYGSSTGAVVTTATGAGNTFAIIRYLGPG